MYSSFASPANSLLFGVTMSSSVSSFWICEELVISAYLKTHGLLAPTLWYSSSDIGVTQVSWGARPIAYSSCSEKGLYLPGQIVAVACQCLSCCFLLIMTHYFSVDFSLPRHFFMHSPCLTERTHTHPSHVLPGELHPCLVTLLLYERLKHL